MRLLACIAATTLLLPIWWQQAKKNGRGGCVRVIQRPGGGHHPPKAARLRPSKTAASKGRAKPQTVSGLPFQGHPYLSLAKIYLEAYSVANSPVVTLSPAAAAAIYSVRPHSRGLFSIDQPRAASVLEPSALSRALNEIYIFST